MTDFSGWSEVEFSSLCQDIMKGLGMSKGKKFQAKGLKHAFRVEIVRESTDSMFLTNEIWFCTFLRSKSQLDVQQVKPLIQATIAAHANYLFVVIFGTLTESAEVELRQELAVEKIQTLLLANDLADLLAKDYVADKKLKSTAFSCNFSFVRLRKNARIKAENAPWNKFFLTTSIQPARLLPLHSDDAALSEADLARALQGGSFLLLGEPGAGKTTSLLALGKELASKGGRTPVFLPLGRYQGDFWAILCEALSSGGDAIPEIIAKALVASGALALMLDGINEVQDFELQRQLVSELKDLIAPDEPTARSLWIVSGRIHDYDQSRYHLPQLEARRWEMQPLTADLVYSYLANALGDVQAKSLYEQMGDSVREICSNPLLLAMTLAVYQKTNEAPVGRGALYHKFVEQLLIWGDERALDSSERKALNTLLPMPLTRESYQILAQNALTALAASMTTTMISWNEAQKQVAGILTNSDNPDRAAAFLLDDLIHRGILRLDTFNRLRFFHHTIQEYFQARYLLGLSPDKVIPKEGVSAACREAVIFLAGLKPDPTQFIRRALDIDLLLAFEIWRDVPRIVPYDLFIQLATRLWDYITLYEGSLSFRRREAVLFHRMAILHGKSIEALAMEINSNLSRYEQTKRLMTFYRHLGDLKGQQRALSKATTGDNVPEELLFDEAFIACESGDSDRALELYTQIIKKNPSDPFYYNNRGVSYYILGRKNEALADFRRATELNDNAVHLSNFALLLGELGQREEAIHNYRLALDKDPNYDTAHSALAHLLEPNDPESALKHRELAVRYAPYDDRIRTSLAILVDLQEKLGRYGEAIRSLRRMVALDPTSPSIRTWKERIARLRQALDAEERTRSARERLQEHGEMPLPTLTMEWLQAAGLTVESQTSNWFLAKGGKGPQSRMPILLMIDPIITGAGLRWALDSLPYQYRSAKYLVVVTAAEVFAWEARLQLAALQDECTVALVTALEVRDAFLQSDRECHLLLDRALKRAGRTDDPYEYKGVVFEHTEFFGRVAEMEDLTGIIGQGQQVGLYGIHKIGKSSLLEQLRRKLHLSHPEITVVKVELDASIKDAGDFYYLVLKELPVSIDLLPTGNVTAIAFRQALAAFHLRRENDRPGHKLLLMLDEYAYLIPDSSGIGGIQDFISVLGLLKSLHQEGWLLLMPCGRTAALNRQPCWGSDDNPFIDLLHPRFLGPMPQEENHELMKTLGRRAGLTFSDDALEAIYAESGGHPAFSRALGSQIIRTGSKDVTKSLVERAVDGLLEDRDQLSILLAIFEKRLDKEEQILARKLAIDGPQVQKALFPASAGIERRRQIRDAIDNLIDTSVLVKQPNGTIAHRYGLLRRVIQQGMEKLGL